MRLYFLIMALLLSIASVAQYKVEWTLLKAVYDPCPDKLKKDIFGRDIKVLQCDGIHSHTEMQPHSVECIDSNTAILFVKRALDQPDVFDIKLNGIKFPKKSESISFGSGIEELYLKDSCVFVRYVPYRSLLVHNEVARIGEHPYAKTDSCGRWYFVNQDSAFHEFQKMMGDNIELKRKNKNLHNIISKYEALCKETSRFFKKFRK